MPETAAQRTDPVPHKDFITLLTQIISDYPELTFSESSRFAWRAKQKCITFNPSTKHSTWTLLHELSHALLSHQNYRYDIELLQLEAAAWQEAHNLAKRYAIRIDESYVQDCLDTYRDWLHLRATCPACYSRSLQTSPQSYRCFNCNAEWHVSRSRLCRPYRLQTA